MEELNNCFIFWLFILVWEEKVENEGRYVPTSNSAREERGELEDWENRALEYICIYYKRVFFLPLKVSKFSQNKKQIQNVISFHKINSLCTPY